MRSSLASLTVILLIAGGSGCRSSLAFYKEGVQQLDHKQYDDAVESFSSAIGKDEGSDLAYLNRGDAYLAMEKYDLAVADYDKAIEIADKSDQLPRPNPWYYNRRGLAHYQAKQYKEALADWKKAQDLEKKRNTQGLKVRKAPAYFEMQALRDEYLPDVEKQAVYVNEVASTPATSASEVKPPENKVEPATGTPSTTPATPESTASSEAKALEAARAKQEAEKREADEQARALEAARAKAAEEQKAAEAKAQDDSMAQARKAADDAAAAMRAQEAAAAKAQADAQMAAQKAAEAKAAQDAAASEEAAQARAMAAARAAQEAASSGAPAPASTAAPAVAAVPAKPKRVANLTGSWIREKDNLAWNLIDDGTRVVGEVAGGEDQYERYEVTLEWKGETRLTGFGVMKESQSPCKFETSVAWAAEAVSADKLKLMVEEVTWDAQCQEKERAPDEQVFARKK